MRDSRARSFDQIEIIVVNVDAVREQGLCFKHAMPLQISNRGNARRIPFDVSLFQSLGECASAIEQQ